MNLYIRQASESDLPALYALYDVIGKKDDGYFERCFEKDCLILMASFPSTVIPLVRPQARSHERNPEKEKMEISHNGSPPFISADADRGDDNGGRNVGFGVLNFEPKYQLYQRLEIPEIQELNVIPEARQQGVATALIEAFENIARDQGAQSMGISVGLTKDYGPAQRLYCKLGYMPDGYGVTYDREAVTVGGSYPMDDDVALMLVKCFS